MSSIAGNQPQILSSHGQNKKSFLENRWSASCSADLRQSERGHGNAAYGFSDKLLSYIFISQHLKLNISMPE